MGKGKPEFWNEKLDGRTFGYEIEFADAVKQSIDLPAGYTWTTNELLRMHNSDSTPITHNGERGGEINTRPLEYSDESFDELEGLLHSIKAAGGYYSWDCGKHVHLFIKDLELDEIKRLFELSYWVAPYLKEIFDVPPWNDNEYISPSPTYDQVQRMNGIKKKEDIPKVFANASHRGHIRLYLNIVPISTIGTMEFRLFRNTWKIEELRELTRFVYAFTAYALNNTDASTYKELNSIDACITAFGIDRSKIPLRDNPLLWASNHRNFVTLVSEGVKKTKGMMVAARDCLNGFDANRVVIVNDHAFDLVQMITSRKMLIMVDNIFSKMLYEVALNDIDLELKGEFAELDMTGDRADKISKILLLVELAKNNNSEDYSRFKREDYVKNFTKYVKKFRNTAERFVYNMDSCEVELMDGNIRDALSVCTDKDILIYQPKQIARIRANSTKLYTHVLSDEYSQVANSNYSGMDCSYANLNLEDVNYIVFSENKYVALRRVWTFRQGMVNLYSNSPIELDGSFYNVQAMTPLKYKRLPEDYKLQPNSNVKFMPVRLAEADYVRTMYLKKSILFGKAKYSYFWFIDDMFFGVTLMDFSPKQQGGQDYVWLKSDFILDSNVPKLSKLLIQLVLSTEFKERLDIDLMGDVQIITTTVFTANSVSMKYRGVFELELREPGKLIYDAKAGSLGKLKSIYKQFYQRYINGK